MIPRSEHPNPQFEREAWESLNGEWEFEVDKSVSGREKAFFERDRLDGKIIVPFCPESSLSGVGDTDFLNCVWYRKTVNIKSKNKRVILHIGACDYEAFVYVNKKEVGTHKGGYTAFAFDITDFIDIGENSVTICAVDDTRKRLQPSGKQSIYYASTGCYYTRTTGIWQTVWLEYVEETHIDNVKYYPDYKNGKVTIMAEVTGEGEFSAIAYYKGKKMGEATAAPCGKYVNVTIELTEIHLWEAGHGRLYDLELSFGKDRVKSYFGLRNVWISGEKFILNGRSVFQRTVLDQGFYPDGIYTAPTEEDFVNDIQLAFDAGFNGARLHEKVFEPRFLYHCDKMGYMVWGEYANWGVNHTDIEALPVYLKEWEEAVKRDFNHPSIVGWCPFNETYDIDGRKQRDEVIDWAYRLTKLYDETRPCIDSSGGHHVMTDIYDYHDYSQNVEEFEENINRILSGELFSQWNKRILGKAFDGGAIFCSEYGGIKWDDKMDESAWGYGDTPKTRKEFTERYEGLTTALLKNDKVMGFCYTQLYDVEQEKNGLYTYSRKPKFDMEIFKNINTQKAAVEE